MFNLKPVRFKAKFLHSQNGVEKGEIKTILSDRHNFYYQKKEGSNILKSDDYFDQNILEILSVEEYIPLRQKEEKGIYILEFKDKTYVLNQCSIELVRSVIEKNIGRHELGGLLSVKAASFDKMSFEILKVIEGTVIIKHSLKDQATDLSSEEVFYFTIYAPELYYNE